MASTTEDVATDAVEALRERIRTAESEAERREAVRAFAAAARERNRETYDKLARE